jgi:hypothetical protein
MPPKIDYKKLCHELLIAEPEEAVTTITSALRRESLKRKPIASFANSKP